MGKPTRAKPDSLANKRRLERQQRPAASDPRDANPDEGAGGPFPIVGIGMSAGGLEVATES